jgi:hypothetical protein
VTGCTALQGRGEINDFRPIGTHDWDVGNCVRAHPHKSKDGLQICCPSQLCHALYRGRVGLRFWTASGRHFPILTRKRLALSGNRLSAAHVRRPIVHSAVCPFNNISSQVHCDDQRVFTTVRGTRLSGCRRPGPPCVGLSGTGSAQHPEGRCSMLARLSDLPQACPNLCMTTDRGVER